ncbi:hypothetical protein ACFFK0_25340 [Paenibacillus chartarius]|uniref:Uncharacterized protein n=1 Tax=Paenibacillus chartarius TaxID=747481 RepID=A0ABV6DT28_9BACL
MRKFNFSRPLLILAAAFLGNSLGKSISLMLGASIEVADQIAVFTMVLAALLVYLRMNRNRNNKK